MSKVTSTVSTVETRGLNNSSSIKEIERQMSKIEDHNKVLSYENQ